MSTLARKKHSIQFLNDWTSYPSGTLFIWAKMLRRQLLPASMLICVKEGLFLRSYDEYASVLAYNGLVTNEVD